MKRLFLNDRFILSVILLNCAILFVEEMGIMHPAIVAADTICILLFTAEMLVKHHEQDIKGYWSTTKQQNYKQNDRAVMQAYGFPIRDFTESDCVARLLEMYQELTDRKN